jgi:signal transduction histidine kinase
VSRQSHIDLKVTLPGARARADAARWVLWGAMIFAASGIVLHFYAAWVRSKPVIWVYQSLTFGIGIAALLALVWVRQSLAQAMHLFAWVTMGCVTGLLIYTFEDGNNILPLVAIFYVCIFTLGLFLGFKSALWYALATSLILLLIGFFYNQQDTVVLLIVLAFSAALPGKVVERLIEQSTAELSTINLQLEELVEARTAELRAEIAERKQAEEALRQRTKDLEKRNQELDAYAHTVAHDLKSPLSSLIGFADLLESRYEQLPNERIPYYLGIIGQNGRKIVNIIDELLLLASVRQLEGVTIEPLDMASIVQDARQRLADVIKEHNAEIIIAETLPASLGHRPWVEEVVVNYVSNAIRYGGVPPVVKVGATADTADGYVHFWVRDNGKGLTTEEQSRLFTPFTQLTQFSAKGHGLGLSIVQRIVDRLNGQVGIESEVGQGSTFFFTLPRAVALIDDSDNIN